jgi:hypothetical protein
MDGMSFTIEDSETLETLDFFALLALMPQCATEVAVRAEHLQLTLEESLAFFSQGNRNLSIKVVLESMEAKFSELLRMG